MSRHTRLVRKNDKVISDLTSNFGYVAAPVMWPIVEIIYVFQVMIKVLYSSLRTKEKVMIFGLILGCVAMGVVIGLVVGQDWFGPILIIGIVRYFLMYRKTITGARFDQCHPRKVLFPFLILASTLITIILKSLFPM